MPAAVPVKINVAAFDVDGTLTTRDCVIPFLRHVRGTVGLAAGLAVRARHLAPALARRDRDAVKAVATHAGLGGRTIENLTETAASFADDVHRRWMRSDTLATLRDHQRHGDTVVLVSASYALYLRPLAERIGVGHVLATEVAFDAAGRCTGEMVGGNCRAGNKVVRLHAWLASEFSGRAGAEVWAYGDSPGDQALLADADHATWVSQT